ncbi:hypothetical protein [Sodalis sp. (in: enterobacteria)]|uniref:hypothetical protein n=1 Tax=Sodalis sp. (in: enterobacteria) TaxID=1898979 RepID=UPI003F687775
MNKRTANSPDLVCKRSGTKAFEYHIDCLPEQTRKIIKQRHYKSLIAQSPAQPVNESVKRSSAIKSRDELAIMRQCPTLIERKVQALNDQQKQIADARMMLAQEVVRLQQAGMTRIASATFIVDESKASTLPEALQRAATLANAKKGRTGQGVGKSSLQEWVSFYLSAERPQERLAILAPGKLKKQRPEEMTWFYALFWPHYARPCGPRRCWKPTAHFRRTGRVNTMISLPCWRPCRPTTRSIAWSSGLRPTEGLRAGSPARRSRRIRCTSSGIGRRCR